MFPSVGCFGAKFYRVSRFSKANWWIIISGKIVHGKSADFIKVLHNADLMGIPERRVLQIYVMHNLDKKNQLISHEQCWLPHEKMPFILFYCMKVKNMPINTLP